MDLYFLPLACSTATRICLYEAGADATLHEVSAKTKKTASGESLFDVNPLGLVPTLRLDDGEILTENAAILQHVAEAYPDAALAPRGARELRQMRQWLSFVATELHKTTFGVLLDSDAPKEAKAYAVANAKERLDVVAKHLEGREFVLDRFSVVDAYLATVLNWAQVTPIDLAAWPVLARYLARVKERPAAAKAFAEELRLYMASR